MKVNPTKTAAGYVGGKHKLAQQICDIIEATPHTIYAEPFVGMGGVFFRRTNIPTTEVINDRSGDIANFFRILQRHYPQFIDTLKFQITSRREFERLKACDPSLLTDLERAVRFLYLQRISFGGKVMGRAFGVNYDRGSKFNLLKLGPILEDLHKRLSGVVIENLDWCDFIDRYDRNGTLFYCDPPYWGTEHYYGKSLFDRDQFSIMAERLKRLKGHFIMSINNVPEIRDLFADFNMIEVDLTYSLNSNKAYKAKELIITNG